MKISLQCKYFISDEFSSIDDKENFFRVLGSGSADKVPEDTTAEDDGAFETKDAAAVTLYKVSDSAGSLNVETISTKPIRQEMLKSEVSHLSINHWSFEYYKFDKLFNHSIRIASSWILDQHSMCGLDGKLLNKKNHNRLFVLKV